jgi:leucine dehydrogenase
MDIYAPCALGATVNNDTLSRLKCSIIAGAANNQLQQEDVHGRMVMDKGIIYAPDFALNAGGVINCYSEVKGLSAEWAMSKAEEIYNTIGLILSNVLLLRTFQLTRLPTKWLRKGSRRSGRLNCRCN